MQYVKYAGNNILCFNVYLFQFTFNVSLLQLLLAFISPLLSKTLVSSLHGTFIYAMDVTHIHIGHSLQTNIVQVSRKGIQSRLVFGEFDLTIVTESRMTSLPAH